MEEWRRIDFITLFGLPDNPLKTFEASSLGRIRSFYDPGIKKTTGQKNEISYIPGTVRPAGSNRPPYKYFSVRLFGSTGKAYKIPFAKCIYLAFSPTSDLTKNDIVFLDKNPINCALSNLKLQLRAKHTDVPVQLVATLDLYANERRLFKMLEYILNEKHIDYTVVYSKEDLFQDFYMFLRDSLHQFVLRKLKDFDNFVFYKAYDFIGFVKRKLSNNPEMMYIDDACGSSFEDSDDPKLDCRDFEQKAVLISDFTYRVAKLSFW